MPNLGSSLLLVLVNSPTLILGIGVLGDCRHNNGRLSGSRKDVVIGGIPLIGIGLN